MLQRVGCGCVPLLPVGNGIDVPTTAGLLRDIAKALDRELSDPAVVAAFDQLVLRGQLAPFAPGWWELMGCQVGELERVLQRGARGFAHALPTALWADR